jgi:hypothetical protein
MRNSSVYMSFVCFVSIEPDYNLGLVMSSGLE